MRLNLGYGDIWRGVYSVELMGNMGDKSNFLSLMPSQLLGETKYGTWRHMRGD